MRFLLNEINTDLAGVFCSCSRFDYDSNADTIVSEAVPDYDDDDCGDGVCYNDDDDNDATFHQCTIKTEIPMCR